MIALFGYGALLNHEHFGIGDPAVLPDYRLRFRGYATVEPYTGEQAYGVLLSVPTLTRFDRMENYPTMYDRWRVDVTELLTGEKVRAWVYVMQQRATYDDYFLADYVEMILRAYEFYGLPLDALEDAVARATEGVLRR